MFPTRSSKAANEGKAYGKERSNLRNSAVLLPLRTFQDHYSDTLLGKESAQRFRSPVGALYPADPAEGGTLPVQSPSQSHGNTAAPGQEEAFRRCSIGGRRAGGVPNHIGNDCEPGHTHRRRHDREWRLRTLAAEHADGTETRRGFVSGSRSGRGNSVESSGEGVGIGINPRGGLALRRDIRSSQRPGQQVW